MLTANSALLLLQGAIRVHPAEIPAVAPNMTCHEVAAVAAKRTTKRTATLAEIKVMWKSRSGMSPRR
jgi:hypothetical protein